jgi:hypothetical protein
MGDLMLDPSAKPAPECTALYRQLAVKLRKIAMGDMDDHLRGDFIELARQYDAQAQYLAAGNRADRLTAVVR